MENSNRTIKLQLGTGFGLIILLMIVLCGVSIYNTRKLSRLTGQSYRHPLAVSNALREIKADIFGIQKLLKGSVLADNTRTVESSLKAIDSCDTSIEYNLAVIHERYLGDKQDIASIVSMYREWEPVRDSILVLVRQREQDDAGRMVLGESAYYVDSLLCKLQIPIDFAADKGAFYYSQALDRGRKATLTIIFLSAILVVLSAIIGLYIIQRSLSDMREFQKIEQELGKARKLESVGRLAGGIAHDFNNMLMPIISYSNMMLSERDRSEQDKDKLEQINFAGRRAAELTRQLLAFSRKQVMEMKILNLNGVVGEMEKMMRRLIGEHVMLQVSMNSELDNIKADRAQLDQILLNIVVNARDAMPEGGRLTIETQNVYLDEHYAKTHEEVVPGDYVMLAVSDTGIGMEPETRDKIFEPFFTTKQKGQGTGLGMATIYGIVKQHNGNINVYSEPGQGTTFKVYLPRVQDSEVLPEKSGELELAPAGKGQSVMVVEDERQVLELVSEILSKNNYKLIKPVSADQALEIAGRDDITIDLLLTDVIMPQMSGRNLYERMKEIRPALKVIYMSGYTDNVIAHHGILDEGIHFLQKPFTEKALLDKVCESLEE